MSSLASRSALKLSLPAARPSFESLEDRRLLSASAVGAFHGYQSLDGDGAIVAQVHTGYGPSAADAGLVVQSSDNTTFVDLHLEPYGVAELDYRDADGKTHDAGQLAAADGYWLKLTRDGGAFAGYVSPTGADNTWRLVGTAGVSVGDSAQVSLTTGDAPAGAGITALSTTAASRFSSLAITPTVPLGGHLNQQSDRIEDRVFVDLVKLTRGFSTIGSTLDVSGNGSRVPTDSNGWPLADFAVSVADYTEYGTSVDAGTYHMRFDGPSNVKVTPLSSGITLVNKGYDSSKGQQTYDVIVGSGVEKLAFNFTTTGGKVKNLKVLQPGYDFSTAPTFNPKYIAFLKQLGPDVLRTMHFTNTIGSLVTNWSDRTTTSTATDARHGIAWEYVIDLANQLNENLWINVPAHATDDYVKQLGYLIKSRLHSNLNVYVEYSNEVWNTAYEETQYNKTLAVQEVIADKKAGRSSQLNYDNKSVDTTKTDYHNANADTWGDRRYARRTKQISDLLKGVFGSSAINTRIRVVLASQFANLSRFDNQLAFLKKFYGDPKNYIYALAVAPYANLGSKASSTTLTKDDVLDALSSSVSGWITGSAMTNAISKAKAWGLKLDAYEAGLDTYGGNSIAAKRAAMLDPKIRDIMVRFLNFWYARGGDQLNWVTLGARSYNTSYGSWSVAEKLTDTNSPKEQAYRQVRDSPRATSVH